MADEVGNSLDQAIAKLQKMLGEGDGEGESEAADPQSAPMPPAAAALAETTAPAPAELQPYQEQVVSSFLRTRGNEVVFLPTGLGCSRMVDAIVAAALERHPGKHAVVVVLRPAQTLTHAERLRAALGVTVGAFCGGDSLYDFPAEFARNRVLVFTAGLLMRLAKLGAYSLGQASLLVLNDAFSAVRNHPMNTLVREYYCKLPSSERPKVLAVVLPQLQQHQRQFDKLRQAVRKLLSGAHAVTQLPTGAGLEALSSRVHHGHVALHGYELDEEEQELMDALQGHCLAVWDTLHECQQNHFGRLLHFPGAPTGQAQQAEQAQRPGSGSQLHTPRAAAPRASSNPGTPEATSHSPPAAATPGSTAQASAATAAVAAGFEAVHHDWDQTALMVRESIAVSESLPEEDDSGKGHSRSEVALAVMKHVLLCINALRRCMELGNAAALRIVLPALGSLQAFLRSLPPPPGAASGATDLSVSVRLAGKVEEVLQRSPLLQWIQQQSADAAAGSTVSTSSSIGSSRVRALLKLLGEVVEHGTLSSAQAQAAPARLRVALVVGDAASAAATKDAIAGAAHLDGFVQQTSYSALPEASPECRDGGSPGAAPPLCITSLTALEAGSPGGRSLLAASDEVLWFSAADVMHAAGFDFDSAAMSTCCQVCAVGRSPSAAKGGTATGPECHVLATDSQAAAWMEVRRADQMLLAAMQLHDAGDAAFEEYLTHLAAYGPGSFPRSLAFQPTPATTLHTLCLGLCGEPPAFEISAASGFEGAVGGPWLEAVAVLPEGMLLPEALGPGGHRDGDGCFGGRPAESEAEARDSSAEHALLALLESGALAAYWPSRQLVSLTQQHRGSAAAAAAAAAAAGVARAMRSLKFTERAAAQPPSASPFTQLPWAADGGAAARPGADQAARDDDVAPWAARGNGGGHPAPPPLEQRLICHVCGIVTTSELHLQEHLVGRRHARALERVQQEQQQEQQQQKGAADHVPPAPPPSLPSSRSLSRSGTLDRLPSSLSDAFLRRTSSLHRAPSGNVYDGFPCVRVGEVVLPSSMDLRAFLDELQVASVADAERSAASRSPEPWLAPIEEASPPGGAASRASSPGGRQRAGAAAGRQQGQQGQQPPARQQQREGKQQQQQQRLWGSEPPPPHQEQQWRGDLGGRAQPHQHQHSQWGQGDSGGYGGDGGSQGAVWRGAEDPHGLQYPKQYRQQEQQQQQQSPRSAPRSPQETGPRFGSASASGGFAYALASPTAAPGGYLLPGSPSTRGGYLAYGPGGAAAAAAGGPPHGSYPYPYPQYMQQPAMPGAHPQAGLVPMFIPVMQQGQQGPPLYYVVQQGQQQQQQRNQEWPPQ